jgi:transposase-like protein
MTYLRIEEVSDWNGEQYELRNNLPSLFTAMLEAENGNSNNLELYIMRKRKLEIRNGPKQIHEYIVLMDKRLNKLQYTLKQEYCDNTSFGTSIHYNNNKMGSKASNKVFEPSDIEAMLLNYIMSFPYGFVLVNENIQISLPALKKFKGEDDEHSNNRLIKYICQNFKKQVLIPFMNKEHGVRRTMDNGKTQVANESIETGNSALVARRYELSPNMVNRWVKEYKEGKFDQDGVAVVSTPLETKKLSQENDHLKKITR